MARRKSFEIRSVSYERGGALVTIFISGAQPSDSPAQLLGGGSSVSVGSAKPARRKREGNKAADVLAAIRAGATSPADISRKSGVDKTQVHAYLAYHKRRGNVAGSAEKGYKVTAAAAKA